MRTEVARERVEGALLGCALGDALGLPMEGLTSRQIAADFEPLDRFRLVGRRGFVSDDTEQTALVAQSLLEGHDAAGVVRRFRHHLKWWVARLPFGIGLATLRAGLRLWFGFRRSGVPSGGNGAAMRAAIIGVVVSDPGLRWAVVDGVSQVTHTHPLAVEGARYIAEAAALLAADDECVDTVLRKALRAVQNPALATAIEQALDSPDTLQSAARIGTTGFVLHTVPLCAWAARHANSPMEGIVRVIRVGGDTDTHAAIVGALLGARFGAATLPSGLLAELHDGPFGPTHLRALATALTTGAAPPRWSWAGAMARNLALYPVILAHGFWRLLPRRRS